MGLLTLLGVAATDDRTDTTDSAKTVDEIARCRGCGRYYDDGHETCPHCGSGNKIRGGGPTGQTRV